MRTNKVLLILRKDIAETFRNKLIYLYTVFFVIFGLSYLGTFSSTINSLAAQNLSFEDFKLAIHLSIDFMFANIPLSISMLTCSIFSAYSVSLEKANRNMESLLATPISVGQVWLGKSLAVAIPSIIISVIISFLVLCGINSKISDYFNAFVFPSALSLVTSLIIVPLMIFLINLLVNLIQMITTNQIIGRLIFIGVFILTFSPTALLGLNSLNSVALLYILACVVLVIAVVLVKLFLTKERVILSSKG